MTSGFWQLAGGHRIDLSGARLMGILNITPDSFSDGGRYVEPHHAVERARELIEGGADLLDIGGESTRPGATRVDAKTQIARVVPVIRAVRDHGVDAPISIDTTLAEVAEAAIEAGASIINDVAAGTESESMLDLAARTGAGLVLMHRLREPGSDSFSNAYPKNPEYDHPRGVTGIVSEFLVARAEAALRAGVAPASIVIDPGLGFGKSVAQNYELIARTPDLLALGFPLLSAASRKSFIGAISGVERASDRVAGSVAVSVAHFGMGVRLFRVHDARQHAEALRVAQAVAEAGRE
ncbi:MAG: dihydropteroate synthase [Phycisphaerales bacterium]